MPPVKGALPDRSSLEVVLDRTGLARVHEGFELPDRLPLRLPGADHLEGGAHGGAGGAVGDGDRRPGSGPGRGRVRSRLRAGGRRPRSCATRTTTAASGCGWARPRGALHRLRPVGAGDRPPRRAIAVRRRARARTACDTSRRSCTAEAAGRAAARAGELTGRWRGTRAFAHHVLAELGQGDAGALAPLFERRRSCRCSGGPSCCARWWRPSARTWPGRWRASCWRSIPGSAGPVIVKEKDCPRLVLEHGRAHHRPGAAGAAGDASPGAPRPSPGWPQGLLGARSAGPLGQHAGERLRPDGAGRAGPRAGGGPPARVTVSAGRGAAGAPRP